MTSTHAPTALPVDAQASRERWIEAACRGHLNSEQLGEKLGISAEAARDIVDAELRATMLAIAGEQHGART